MVTFIIIILLLLLFLYDSTDEDLFISQMNIAWLVAQYGAAQCFIIT